MIDSLKCIHSQIITCNDFLFLTLITAILCALAGLYPILKRQYSITHLSFLFGMFSVSLIELGDFMTLKSFANFELWKRIALAGEIVFPFSWLLFTITFCKNNSFRNINRYWKFSFIMFPMLFAAMLSNPVNRFFIENDNSLPALTNAGYILYLIILLYSIVILVNLEGILRSVSSQHRGDIKYIIIGLSGIILFNIFYYSHILLHHSLNMKIVPARSGIIICCLFIIGIALFKKRESKKIYISKWVAYRSIALFAIGTYLLGLGLVGKGMSYLGPNVKEVTSVFIFFLGVIVLLIIFLNAKIRRKVRVYIDKNLYKSKYEYRTQWLQFTESLFSKTSLDEILDVVLKRFSAVIETEQASIWLHDASSNHYKLYKKRNVSEFSVTLNENSNLIAFFDKKRWIYDVRKPVKEIIQENQDFFQKTNPSLIIPLQTSNMTIGFVMLGKSSTFNYFNYEDFDLLKTLAKQATSAIMNAKLAEELSDAREMEAMGKMASFVLHDLKNLTTALSFMSVDNETDTDHSEGQVIHSITKEINKIINKIKDINPKTNLKLEPVNLSEMAREVIEQISPDKDIQIIFEGCNEIAIIDREEIKKVLLNLILNSIDAIKRQGTIKVAVYGITDSVIIEVSDTGCGIPETFIRKNLFKPFKTTKNKGLGIGLYQCKTIIEAHGGKLTVKSKENEVTTFRINLRG